MAKIGVQAMMLEDSCAEDAKALDVSMIRIGMLPFDAMGSLDTVLEFCDATNDVAARLAEHGIRLYHHNHHIEFATYDGKQLLDTIADRAPLLGLELDVHWIQRGGLDPVSTIAKYGDRVAMVHLKDYRIGSLPDSAFQALAEGDVPAFMAAFTGVVQFAEVREGNLDFRGIVEQSIRSGAEYLLVKQDDVYGRDVFDCLTTSRENLMALGYSDLF
ncbi:sugar phosphate isomerase/epimerase [Mycetocola sp. CAN_C7]|uniref:sugar phosphate isomerase/epimerase family protein n=1 Tax=Mycetocola sp. CAN_C7 TaxID=2787724 RepID=UPI001A2828BB